MQLRYNREQLLHIRKQLTGSKAILYGRSIKKGKPLRNIKLSKNNNSNSRINQTSKCTSGLPQEKVDKIGSNPILSSQIQSHSVIDLTTHTMHNSLVE